MGSLTRQSFLERVLKEFGPALNKAADQFVGQRIVAIGDTEVAHRIQNDITLETGESYTAIWRWSSEEEQSKNVEIPDEDVGEWLFVDYLNKMATEQRITASAVGLADRDDEIVLFLTLENDAILEIDTGIFAEQDSFSGWATAVLRAADIEAFFEKEWVR